MKLSIILLALSLSTKVLSYNAFFHSENFENFCKSLRPNNISKVLGSAIEADAQGVLLGVQKDNDISEVKIYNTQNQLVHEKEYKGKIKDFTRDANHTYLMFADRVEILNSSYEVERTIFSKESSKRYTELTAIGIHNRTLYYSQGRLGLVAHGLDNEVTNNINLNIPQPSQGHESMITDFAIHNNKIFLAIDNVTYDFNTKKRAFEGIGIYDLNSNKVELMKSINQRREAYGLPEINVSNGRIVTKNLHLLFSYDLEKLSKSKYAWPQTRLWKYGQDLKEEVVGRHFMDDQNIYTCTKTIDAGTSQSLIINREDFNL